MAAAHMHLDQIMRQSDTDDGNRDFLHLLKDLRRMKEGHRLPLASEWDGLGTNFFSTSMDACLQSIMALVWSIHCDHRIACGQRVLARWRLGAGSACSCD